MNDPLNCWLNRRRFYRTLATYNISKQDFHDLAAYNGDHSKGVVFSADTVARMGELQDRYNTYRRNTCANCQKQLEPPGPYKGYTARRCPQCKRHWISI